MLIQEDGIWITHHERLHIFYEAGIWPNNNDDRALFEAALPSATNATHLYTDDEFDSYPFEVNPTLHLAEIAKQDLQSVGFDPAKVEDSAVYPDDQPADTTNRFQLPLEVAPTLARLLAHYCETVQTCPKTDKESTMVLAENARKKAEQILEIMPAGARLALASEDIFVQYVVS